MQLDHGNVNDILSQERQGHPDSDSSQVPKNQNQGQCNQIEDKISVPALIIDFDHFRTGKDTPGYNDTDPEQASPDQAA